MAGQEKLAGNQRVPAVSIVIPAYNASSFLEQTLDSVRVQTFRDFEVLVVDDGSSDDTCAVAGNYLERHALPGRSIQQSNKGIAGARNTGMRAARGRFIALLDHDDLWYPNKLEIVLEEFERHPEVDLVGHNENITRDGHRVSTTRNGPWVPHMYERLLFTGNALSPSATVLRKDSALAIGGFRENPEFNTVEDYDFWMRLSRGSRFLFLDRVLGEYQLVERAASRKVVYHHSNLESLLRDHFASWSGGRSWMADRWRMRKRLAMVYRSALGQLMNQREAPEDQARYAWRMLRAYPLDSKNLFRAALWVASRAVQHWRGQSGQSWKGEPGGTGVAR